MKSREAGVANRQSGASFDLDIHRLGTGIVCNSAMQEHVGTRPKVAITGECAYPRDPAIRQHTILCHSYNIIG